MFRTGGGSRAASAASRRWISATDIADRSRGPDTGRCAGCCPVRPCWRSRRHSTTHVAVSTTHSTIRTASNHTGSNPDWQFPAAQAGPRTGDHRGHGGITTVCW